MALPEYVFCEPPRATAAPAITVVIPAYNEAKRIAPFLEQCAAYFTSRGEAHEILVCSDGSRDNTVALVREMAQRPGLEGLGLLHYERNRGKGHAVRMGMLGARGTLRLFADADGSTPIAEVERLKARLQETGADIAIGSRQLSAPGIERQIKPHRYVIGQGFRIVRQLMLSTTVLDSQCGFKLFSAEAARTIFGAARVDGFAFDVELLYLAARAGFRVEEVAVNWKDDAASRVNLLLDPFKMVRDMWRIRRLHRKTVLTRDTQ